MENSLKEAALKFHEFPVPGKISVTPTKSLATSKDLALAYSPGVAAPCMEIHADPQNAYKYTAKGNDKTNDNKFIIFVPPCFDSTQFLFFFNGISHFSFLI